MIRDLIRKVASKTPGLRSVRDWDRGAAPTSAPVATPPPARGSGPLPGKEQPNRVEPERSRPAVAPTAAPPVAPASAATTATSASPATPTVSPAPPAASPATPTASPAPPAAAPAPRAAAPAPPPSAASEASASKKGGKKGGKKADARSVEAAHADSQPADSQPAGSQAADSKPAGSQAADSKPADSQPADSKAPARAPSRDEEAVEALRLEAEQRKAEIRARKEAEARAAAPAPAVGGIAALIAQSGGQVDQIATSTGTVKAVNNWVPDDTEIHVAEDGVEYWGSVDNESARAYARGEKLVIDQWECINCGTCVENTDHVFVLPMDAKAVVISQEGPMDLVQDAIDACPVTCIHWTDNPDQFEQINDAEGNPLH